MVSPGTLTQKPGTSISVIVPTYNRPELLKRALDSIAAQTKPSALGWAYPHYEAVVVNDGGVDISPVIDLFPFARLITHRSNSGLPAARNTGIEHSKGGYLAYLDDDDIYYPDHLATLAEYINGHRAAYTDADILFRNAKPRLYMSNDFSRLELRKGNLFPVCCMMHERSLIDEVGGFDEELPSHEDWDLWIKMSDVCDFYHVKKVTCMVDKSHLGMMNDGQNMRRGYFMVQNKYAKNPVVLPPIA